MRSSDVVVVIPTLNNDTTIQKVVDDALSYGYSVIAVDDGYTNPLANILKPHSRVSIVTHSQNRGKGEAIISGAKKARQMGYSFFISIDGDGQHLASEIEKLLAKKSSLNQIIIGARNFSIANVPNGSKFGRWFSNFWACWDTGYKISDSLSGFRLYPISILELDIKTKRFDWEMEVLVKHADSGGVILEADIECYYPQESERVTHFRKFSDTMAIVWVHVQILPFKWPKMLLDKFRK